MHHASYVVLFSFFHMNCYPLSRMVYLSESGWGQRDFEADSETAGAVVQKLNYLLDLRQSNARKQRKEYLVNKEKKKLKPKLTSK